MSSADNIFDQVRNTLIDALGVDDSEVTPDASLTRDLGAESIDFLDIVFRLEKSFDIKIPRGDLFPENVLTDPDFVADGKVSDKGIDELRKRLPHADVDKFAENPNVQDIGDLFTVEMITRYIAQKIET
ncbi:MAG: acyl carrier protein [Planctomycetota bacterium]|jgi:acyl carrier protein|nr:acyl carrier protein [Planctomycetota bacterium]|tara:strand:+ start:72 stop:458 length:387 start_codon:yes stop_codon:yes gene_type:complete